MDNSYSPEQNRSEKNGRRQKPDSGGIFYRVFNGNIDIPFFMLVMIILTIGLVMMFSASYVSGLYNEGSSYYYISRQLVFAVAGVAAMIIISRVNYKFIRKCTFPLLVITMILLVVVRLMPPVDGVYRWIRLGLFTIQPSEIAKFTLVIVLAHFISLHPEKMNDAKYTFFLLAIVGVFTAMIMIEKHLSATILMFCIGMSVLWAGGLWNKHKYALPIIIVLGVAVVALLIGLIYWKPEINSHAAIRIQSWLDKDFEPLGARWQTNQSLYAIGSGGLLGSGLGQSMQKYLYVSEPQNDFIFAIVCEELGFVGAVIIIVLFALLIYRGILISMKCKNMYGSLVVMGIVFQIGIQVLLNIAVVTDTIPNTGISLPFFSYGGTSLMMLLGEMGIILSISRTANIEKL